MSEKFSSWTINPEQITILAKRAYLSLKLIDFSGTLSYEYIPENFFYAKKYYMYWLWTNSD